MNSYKFSSSATETAPDILRGVEAIDFLRSKYVRGCIFGLHELQSSGHYRISGWSFDFRPWMKRYIVKYGHGHLQEYYAPNKTLLRRTLYGRIAYIQELQRKAT